MDFMEDFRRRMMMGLPVAPAGPDAFTTAMQKGLEPIGPAPTPPFMPQPAPAPKPQTPRQMFDGGIQAQLDAIGFGADAEARKADLLATGAKTAADDLVARQQADEADTAADQQRLASARAKLDKDAQEVADTKIERGKVFREMPLVDKLAVAVQSMVTGLADLKSGRGPEKAMAIVNKIIADDVQDQMVNLENKRASVASQQSRLQMDQTDTYRSADLRTAATLRAYDAAVKQFQAVAAQTDSEIVRAAALKGAGMVQQQAGQVYQGWQHEAHQERMAERQAAIAGGHLSLARRGQDFEREKFEYAKTRDQEKDALQLEIAQLKAGKGRAPGGPEPPPGLTPKEARELEIRGADGRVLGYAADPASAREVRSQVGTYESTRDDLVKYMQAVKENGRKFAGLPGTKWLASKEYLEMKSMHRRLATRIKGKAMADLGVLTGNDFEILLDMVPEPQSLTSMGGDPLPGIRSTLQALDGNMDKFLRIQIPGAERYSPMSFEDFGGSQKAVAPGEGRTSNSMSRPFQPGYSDQLPPLPASVTNIPVVPQPRLPWSPSE